MADLKELLGEELLNQVNERLGDNKLGIVSDGSYIPKTKFDEVIVQKNNFKTQHDAVISELEMLKKSSKDNEKLATQLTNLQTKLQEADAKNKDISMESAIRLALVKANAKYDDLLLGKIDKSKIEIGEDGSVCGLDEQITSLKQNYRELFANSIPSGLGTNPQGGSNAKTEIEQLNDQLDMARKSGNTTMAISLRNKIFELMNKK